MLGPNIGERTFGEGVSFVQSGSHSPQVLSCLFLPKALACLYYWNRCTHPTQGNALLRHGLGLAKCR